MIFFRILPALLLIPVLATPPKPAPGSREQQVRQMMSQLSLILGVSPGTAPNTPAALPQLRFQPLGTGDSSRCIRYNPAPPGGKPQIIVMEALVAHCETYGDRSRDALAFLLGHEMAHHYHHHGQAGLEFAALTVKGAKSPTDRINQEAIADQSGVFAAYFSGYDAFTVAPLICADVYKQFVRRRKGPDYQPPGYLPLDQRVKMIRDTSMRVQEVAHWCELAEFFYLMENYPASEAALSEVYNRYPAPFIANNLGAAKLNHALALMGTVQDEPLLRFAFPVEYDTDNRLLNSKLRDKSDDYKQFLEDARMLFTGVLQTRPGYEAARINLAIVELLQNKPEQARNTLQPLLNDLGPRPANAVLMMGIIESVAGNSIRSHQYMSEAKKMGAFRAAYNENMAKSDYQKWLERLFAFGNSRQSPTKKTQPQLPANLNQGKAEKSLGRIAGTKANYTRTDKLTRYVVSVRIGSEIKPYRLVRSTVLPLPNLPLGSTRQVLAARFAPPLREVAGARQTVWLGYGTLQSGLWLEYRANELIGWIAYEPDR